MQSRPQLAAGLWPAYPAVTTHAGFAKIGQAIASGRNPDDEVIAPFRELVRRDPLAVAPFLVEGTRHLSNGNVQQADQLLTEAVRRDPRDPAARFLLSQLYLEQGKTKSGLDQVAALVRRVPSAAASLLPAIAEFAKQPGAQGDVRAFLRDNPQLRDGVLEVLAGDAANVPLILKLAGSELASAEPPAWQSRLLTTLMEAGDYMMAYRLWQRFVPAPPAEPGLFNPGFETLPAPPPFNWTLTEGSVGTAEPAAGGLHLLYYGREDGRLASQTMVLRPGQYELRWQSAGSADATKALSWIVTCLPTKKVQARQTLSSSKLSFTVPARTCGAQTVELWGSMTEDAATLDLNLRDLRLVRVAS